MAEMSKASAAVSPPPRRPAVRTIPHTHAVRAAAPLRLSFEEAENPAPKARQPEPSLSSPETAAPPRDEPTRSVETPRAPAERALQAVLLVSLGLTLAAFLISGLDGPLTGADALFAGAVLLSGVALLALAEFCRRGSRH